MIKLLLPLLIAPVLEARVSVPRDIIGKLIQVTYSVETPCGSEYIAIVQTRTNFQFIYLYNIKKANLMLPFVDKKVKVIYTETIGELRECNVGLVSIKEIK